MKVSQSEVSALMKTEGDEMFAVMDNLFGAKFHPESVNSCIWKMIMHVCTPRLIKTLI